jgi:putative CocE/NonD family hydrolase
VKHEVVFEDGLDMSLEDGIRLRAAVWRPRGEGRHPVLLLRTPYGRLHGEDFVYPHPSWFARHGYAVVTQDVRGRFGSEGEFDPFVHEADDGCEAVEWAAELPFSNGSVGMSGMSYPGLVQFFAASRRPGPLKAIAPMLASPTGYEGWVYDNGAFALAFNVSWATYLGAETARRRSDSATEVDLLQKYVASAERYGHLPLDTFPDMESSPYFYEWLRHESYDEYWKARTAIGLDASDVASLCIGGWYDVFVDGTIRGHRELRSSPGGDAASLIVTPWWHSPLGRRVGELDFGAEASAEWIGDRLLRFFGPVLRGEDVAELPRIQAFVTGGDRWETAFETWPPPSSPLELHVRSQDRANSLHGDGRLTLETPGDEHPDRFTYDPVFPTPSLGGRSCCFPTMAPMGPADQRPVELLNSVLVYTSDPLPNDLLTAGAARFTLHATSTAPDTDWTVKVCDVHPDGTSINVREAIQRARFAFGGERTLEPDSVYEFDIALGNVCHLFRAGHRVRVDISSCSFPHWNRNLNTGRRTGQDTMVDRILATQTVFHDRDRPSRLTLPAVAT